MAEVDSNTNHDSDASFTVKEEIIDDDVYPDYDTSTATRTLQHKLRVRSADGRVVNLLCPLELVFQSSNFSAPLIPDRYDPELFCMFANVTSGTFKASSIKLASNNRKRKNEHKSQNVRSPKKRKKTHSHQSKPSSLNPVPHTQRTSSSSAAMINTSSASRSSSISSSSARHHGRHRSSNNSSHAADSDLFSYQPTLNVNSRPKRQRKKVSYKEPDPHQIPVVYIKPDTRHIVHSTKIPKKTAVKVESVVEMRWVQCDKCLKWRRIPTFVSDKELEGAWACVMNIWDKARNTCLADEEEYDLSQEQTMKVSNGSGSSMKAKERRHEFYGKLQLFYERQDMVAKQLNTRQLEMSKIGHKVVDFVQLYLEVTRRGGYEYCKRKGLFNEVFASLSCYQSEYINKANMSLENLYRVYLFDYEKTYYTPVKQDSNEPFVAQHAM